jgi:hypothetical protein
MVGKKAEPKTQMSHEDLKAFAESLTAESFNTNVKCPGCEVACATAKGLVTHLKKHGATAEDVKPILCFRQQTEKARKEREPIKKGQKKEMTELERSSLYPQEDYTKVKCKCGQVVPKANITWHFTESKGHKDDPVAKGTILMWHSVKDGWQISNGKSKECCASFEELYHAGGQAQPASSQPPQQGFDKMTDAICQAIAAGRITNASGSIVPQPPGSIVSQGSGKPVQASLRQEALDFKKLSKEEMEANEARKVYVWPLPKKSGILPPALISYMKSRCNNSKTAWCAEQGVDYFFCAFKIDGPELPILTVYKELVAQGLISQAMTLELWDASIPWTSKMNAGMTIFGDWLGIHAEDLGDEKGIALAASLGNRYLKPLMKQLPKAKQVCLARRKRIDGKRRHQLPPVALQGAAVNWSLIDLNIICDKYQDMFEEVGTIPPAARRVINANTLGVFAYRTYPGRPGEQEQFPLSAMEECLADPAAWYVKVEHHKTEATHGAMGREVPPELKEVLVKVVKFGCRKRNLLFVPARQDTPCIQVNKALTDWAGVYTPGYQHPEPSLNRKAIETEIAHRDNVEKAAKMNELIPDTMKAADQASVKAARMAGHHKTTANKHYILESGNPEQDALTSKAYIQVFKGPLPPLTPEQVKAKESRTATDVLDDFARLLTRKTVQAASNEDNAAMAEPGDEGESGRPEEACNGDDGEGDSIHSGEDEEDTAEEDGEEQGEELADLFAEVADVEEQEPEQKPMEADMPEEASAPDTHDGIADEESGKDEEMANPEHQCRDEQGAEQKIMVEAEPGQPAAHDGTVLKDLLQCAKIAAPPPADDDSLLLLPAKRKSPEVEVPSTQCDEAGPSDAGGLKKQRTQAKLDVDYGFPLKGDALGMLSPPRHDEDTTQQTLLPGAAEPKPMADGPKRGFSMAFQRKVPVKLEGVAAIEQFIMDQVRPEIDNCWKLGSKTFAKEILTEGLAKKIFNESHTHEGIRSYINRNMEKLKAAVAASVEPAAASGEKPPDQA